ncbi:osmotin-like protein, partial [Phtheirospermum japonicum]
SHSGPPFSPTSATHPSRGGFPLHTLTHHSLLWALSHWSGRIWARTGCSHSNSRFSCTTGECGGRLKCAALATLAQFSLQHSGADLSSYDVSLVDGYNVPMIVTPHEGKGRCPVVGCRATLPIGGEGSRKKKIIYYFFFNFNYIVVRLF